MISLKNAPERRRFFEQGWRENIGTRTKSTKEIESDVAESSSISSKNQSQNQIQNLAHLVPGITTGGDPENHKAVYFHTVDRDPEGGLIGCTRSHMACWQKALAMNSTGKANI